MPPRLQELADERTVKQREVMALFAKYPDLGEMTEEDQGTVKTLNARLAAINLDYTRFDELQQIEEAARAGLARDEKVLTSTRPPYGTGRNGHTAEPGEPADFGAFLKGIGPLDLGTAFRVKGAVAADLLGGWQLTRESKVLITTGDIAAVQRQPGIMAPLTPALMVADLPTTSNTTATSIEYYAETTTTNAAAPVAEGAAKPESTLDFTLVQQPIATIATWVQATKQLLADVDGIEAYFRDRLGFFVRQTLDAQVLNGNGTAPNMRGYLATAGIQTEAAATGALLTHIYNAITKVRNAGAEPTGLVMNPTDWGGLRMAVSPGGVFYFGGPNDVATARAFGVPVVVTSTIAQGTALVGAFRPHSTLWMREGADIAISDSHASNFVSNILVIRCELRAALSVYRPAAFCSLTGIPVPT